MLKSDNRNVITMVVAGEKTVLGFDEYDDQSLRCYASRERQMPTNPS